MRPAWAAEYPSKALSMVVPFGAGGVADVTARTVARVMAHNLAQPVVIENRPGAGGITATSSVVRAKPDGYTMLLISNATAISSTLFPKQPFDVQKDLQPISTLGHFDLAVCVSAQSPYQSMQELLAYAKANPGKLTIGTIAIGSTQHLTAELFKTRTGIDALVVPYGGSPDVITALRSGQVDVAIDILSPLLAQLQAKTPAVRALAVTAAQRNPLLPDVPSAAEVGIADFEVSSWNALAVPKNTPQSIVTRLEQAVRQALADTEVDKTLRQLGIRPEASTPEALGSLLENETQRWRQVIQAANIAVG
ncbi:tripartite tricarboxylate transporter substrate binding protein [Lampropedia puyangensis]|uniref:Tripartite tricarboxylate transporter substrate binding protein n=2 Tax=Lampropedia puyangensis TaxID=1330072 RepID=A0A4V4GQA9_9BURK|nr:tripartite tricarboxylate transporter substrate binding protein [Lampropedia puyangensis]